MVGGTEGIASANAALYGTAFSFNYVAPDFGNYVDIGQNNTTFNFLTRDGALSYAAWIKPSATQDFPLPTFIGTPGSAFDFRIAQPASGPDWNLRLQSGNTAASGVATTVTIPSDVWTHVAVTKEAYNATTNPTPAVKFYVNGVFAESGTVGRAGSGSTTKRLFIGAGALTTEYYKGGVDEVYVYDEVLDASTIAGLAGVAPLPGDYNHDSKVDASDYVVWRKDPTNPNYGGDPGGYDTWRANFGNPPGSGSGSLLGASVPEPSTLALVGLLASLLIVKRRSRVELLFVAHDAAYSAL
jgi:hypothetical protein